MGWVYFLLLLHSIYTIYYVVFIVHRPIIYSRHQSIIKLASRVVCPMFLLPFGTINSLYQIIRKVEITKYAVRKQVLLEVDYDSTILLEIFEPLLYSSKKKSRPLFIFLGIIFETSSRNIFSVVNITLSLLRWVIVSSFRICYAIGSECLRTPRKNSKCKVRHISEERKVTDEKLPGSNDSGDDSRRQNNVLHIQQVDPLHAGHKYNSVEENVLLVHGLNGTSRSTYIKGMANEFLERNCRVFCFNVRGALLPSTSNTFNHIGLVSDIEKTVEYILDNYSGSLSLVGFSMGANWIAMYLGNHPESDRIKMGIGVCCPFDFGTLRRHFCQTFYGKFLNFCMAKNYKKYISRSMKSPIYLDHCKYLEDIDKELLQTVFKFNTLEEFYDKSSCISVIDNISVPMLFLSASDDPIIPRWVIPSEKYKNNQNLSFLILSGGHLGFFANRSKTNAETLVGKYFDVINGLSAY
ncbi:uncharacterized protein VICG_00349 [Vittaforma corneae ATCC 50505]|uniref:AB hydrolase-1 domain-containing protein n=1 Tax=Vittaforma corneae (strain ATCC 50505) TaxID=993615 RepID=L2GQL2_VITCO|nr:uncharacterized protein VICG_00349 [Vittaforma corneae ATCC 50505]ELA42597.1 hypothetical protein VICG_00349 [Vittaforma corneae ATCC 50505]